MSTATPINIDIIIPIYNALDDVQTCVRTILANRCGYNISLILVNDSSGEETSLWLREFAITDPAIKLVEHDTNKGYSQAINTGLECSVAPYVVLMNSDTIPSETWLSDLLRCLESDSRLGIVSPLSNSAVKQSVPSLQDILASTVNFPSQQEVNTFAELLKEYSYSIYPIYPFIHGFCHLITRETINAIGNIDAVSFPNGMGSEIEYCMRAKKSGFLSAVADDAFVYHSKAKSLTETSRFSEDWRTKISDKYGAEEFQQALDEANHYPALNAIRMATSHALFQKKLNNKIQSFRYNFLVLLNEDSGDDLLDDWLPLIRSMRSIAIQCQIGIPKSQLESVFKKYKHLSNIQDLFIGYSDEAQIISQARYYDAVMVTEQACLLTLLAIQDEIPDILPVYYLYHELDLSEEATVEYADHIEALKNPLLLTDRYDLAKHMTQVLGIHTYLFRDDSLPASYEKMVLAWNSRSLIGNRKKTEWLLRLLNSKLISHRLELPANAFDKGVPSLEHIETLEGYFANMPSLMKRRMKKLINNPHAYFSDSENLLLRPLRHLFKS